jgi:hypothetical protein
MIRHSAHRTAICVIATSLLWVACLGQASRNAPGGNPALKQYFFGSSQDVQQCASAWLLYLDREHDNGGVFVVANMEQFSKLELARDGRLLFEWSGFGNLHYRFNGALKTSEIAGEVQLVDPRSHLTKHLCSVTATELPPQEAGATPAQQESPARYSNMGYSSEGGDLTGVEIYFFSTPEGTQGMITFYEGYWREPVDTPLLLSEIEIGRGRIRFSAKTPRGVGRYHLILGPRGALFGRDDVAPEERGVDILLKKTPSVLPPITW